MKKMPKIINGNVTYNSQNDYSAVDEIKGSLHCPKAGKVEFPKLTAVGGYLHCREAGKDSFPKLKRRDVGKQKAFEQVRSAFWLKGFSFFDGILAVHKETKQRKNGTKIHKMQVVGKEKMLFCVEVDGVFSHGDTLKEAKESMGYKISNRDKSAYDSWTLNKTITKREAIESYRVITGACEYGCRHFVDNLGKTKSKYKVSEIIELTKDQYGNDMYAEFFKRNN